MTEPTPLSATTRARTQVRSAVADAARRTDTDFEYLLAQARLESGLRPNAKARTSSATGLFQFIESTWLATMKRHGPALGYGDVAANIQQSGGRFYVADPAARRDILNMRKDPQTASLMAGALAQENRNAILPVLGREPQATELYMAHFLGAGDARRFLAELDADPSQAAAALFPRPASANQSIFYRPNGASRDLGEVMGLMQGKMSRAIAANGRLPEVQPWIAPDTRGLFGDEGLSPYPRRAARMIPGSDAPYAARPFPPGGIQPAPELPSRAPNHDAAEANSPPAPRPPMSQLLRDSFSLGTARSDDPATEQVRRAYAELKAFGL